MKFLRKMKDSVGPGGVMQSALSQKLTLSLASVWGGKSLEFLRNSKFRACAYLVICLFEGGGLLDCSPTLLQKWDDSTSLPQMGVEPLIAVKNLIR